MLSNVQIDPKLYAEFGYVSVEIDSLNNTTDVELTQLLNMLDNKKQGKIQIVFYIEHVKDLVQSVHYLMQLKGTNRLPVWSPWIHAFSFDPRNLSILHQLGKAMIDQTSYVCTLFEPCNKDRLSKPSVWSACWNFEHKHEVKRDEEETKDVEVSKNSVELKEGKEGDVVKAVESIITKLKSCESLQEQMYTWILEVANVSLYDVDVNNADEVKIWMEFVQQQTYALMNQ